MPPITTSHGPTSSSAKKKTSTMYVSNRSRPRGGFFINMAITASFDCKVFQMPKSPQGCLLNPRGLRADNAAAYLGMGKTKFLELVDKGVVPKAIDIEIGRAHV